MKDQEAIQALQAIEATMGWKIMYVTRDDVASRWYPEAEDAAITDEQWAAVQGTWQFRKLHENDNVWDIIWQAVDDACEQAEADLDDPSAPVVIPDSV